MSMSIRDQTRNREHEQKAKASRLTTFLIKNDKYNKQPKVQLSLCYDCICIYGQLIHVQAFCNLKAVEYDFSFHDIMPWNVKTACYFSNSNNTYTT